MPQLHLLRVFCAEDGSFGNPLGVFLDGSEVAEGKRQAVAAALGLSEIVFVDDEERGNIRIFTPVVELDFAGHPAVGAAWLLDHVASLHSPAGELAVTRAGDNVYVAARPEWGPPWELAQLGWARFRSSGSLRCRLGGDPSSFGGESVLLGSEDNVSVISMWLGQSAPLPPPKGTLYGAGCTKR